MNEHQLYETPVTQVLVVNNEEGILQNSINANRSSYGAAQTDTWD